MNEDILKGLRIGLGIFISISLLFGLVFAVGFHSPSEILAGAFIGNYSFSDNVGIGTSSPQTELEVNGRIFTTSHGTSPTNSSGMFNSFNPILNTGIGLIQAWNYTAGSAKNISLQAAGGNVGIVITLQEVL